MGVRTPSDETPYEPPPIGPPPLSAALLGFVLLVVLVSNGRPIGSADARPTERVAATLAQHGRLDLSLNRYRQIVQEEAVHCSPKEILANLARIEMELQHGMHELEGILK